MKVVILAGGLGTRISEETSIIPKPLIKIGNKPLLWHIMNIYSTYGFNEFVICLGYKGEQIKRYFSDFHSESSDFTIDMSTEKFKLHNNNSPKWKVTLIDTGQKTMTGGRLKRIAKYLDGEMFMMTYGDGLADINIKDLLKFHKSHGKMATVTAVKPAPRFGSLNLRDDGKVLGFQEKKDHPWINGGFFALSKRVLDFIDDDSTPFEGKPIQELVKRSEIFAYKHTGFWKGMDTLSDKNSLEAMWEENPPWKIWKG